MMGVSAGVGLFASVRMTMGISMGVSLGFSMRIFMGMPVFMTMAAVGVMIVLMMEPIAVMIPFKAVDAVLIGDLDYLDIPGRNWNERLRLADHMAMAIHRYRAVENTGQFNRNNRAQRANDRSPCDEQPGTPHRCRHHTTTPIKARMEGISKTAITKIDLICLLVTLRRGRS